MGRTFVPWRLLLACVIAGWIALPRDARAIDVPIGISFGWVSPHGELAGKYQPGWRLSVAISGDVPDKGRFGATFGYQQFHFDPERLGHAIQGTPYTLHDAVPADVGLLQAEARYYFTRAEPLKVFAEAGMGMGGMTFGYDAIGPDSIGVWGDGVFAVDFSAGVGAKLRLTKYLKLGADVRVDSPNSPGASLVLYSVNAGPVFLLHVPGLSEMQPGWLRRGMARLVRVP